MEIRTAQKGVTLGERFVQTARRNWARRCMCDSAGRSFTHGQALVNSIALSGVIERLSSGQEKVGILLPPSTAAAVSNIAVTLAGKVPVTSVTRLQKSRRPQLSSSAVSKLSSRRAVF